jgi:hypothetical protein
MDELNQTIVSSRTNLDYDATDEELILAIEKAKKESEEIKNKIDKIGETNQVYWQTGAKMDKLRQHPKKQKVIVNRIFADVETMIPILTSETPEAEVLYIEDNDLKLTLTKALEIAWDVDQKMQMKVQKMARSWFINRLGILKYRWSKEKGFVTDNVVVKKMGFDKRATMLADCEYVWEEMEDSIENLQVKFANKKEEIEKELGEKKSPKSKVKYIEFWGGNANWVCWKLGNVILDKKKNPNYDFENKENNVFDCPKFPYLLLSVLNLGIDTSVYDSTSLIEEASPIQDTINKLEEQIYDLNEGNKRVWIAAGRYISEKKAQDIVNETGDLLVYLDRAETAGEGLGQVQAGRPDAAMYNNLTHLLAEIDNIMGIHSTTRGERAQQETATGRQLLMGSDYGRLDMVVRNIEEVAEDWFLAYLQMHKIYAISDISLSNGKDSVILKAEEIPSEVNIKVTKGSTLPTDDASRHDNALKLASYGMIDPFTLFEELGYSSLEKRVKDLYAWLQATGKMTPQQQQQVGGQNDQSGAQELGRIQQMIQSPEFKKLPPDQQQQFIQQAKAVVEKVKGQGGQIQQ